MSKSTVKQKGKRPDVKKKILENKDKEEFVIKCSLSKRVLRPKVKDVIEEFVLDVSKAMNRGSLVFNRLLLHCLTNDFPLPDFSKYKFQTSFKRCMNVGVGKMLKGGDPLIKEVWEKYFKDFPVQPKPKGSSDTYTYATIKYMTNFSNYLVYTFQNRQKYEVRRWCKENDVKESWPIICAINNKTCRTKPDPKALWFIRLHKFYLKNKDKEVGTGWLKDNLHRLVKYYWVLFNEAERKSTLAPICKVQRAFITIDTTILGKILRKLGYFFGSNDMVQKARQFLWNKIFVLPKEDDVKRNFSYLIDTDGVSVCFHYKRDKRIKGPQVPISDEEQVIAIDPGRQNLIFAINEEGRSVRLTKKNYYRSSGMTKRMEKSKKWMREVHVINTSLKTRDPKDWEIYLEEYVEHYHSMWEGMTKKKWARADFRVYALKNSLLDQFFSTLNCDIVAYGAAKFNPTGKNELSAPTTSLSRKCSQHRRVVFIDEYNTTKTCTECGSVLANCLEHRKLKDGRMRWCSVRGLKWCTTKCFRPVNRDKNAALNILKASIGTHPYHLSRDFNEPYPDSVRLNRTLIQL